MFRKAPGNLVKAWISVCSGITSSMCFKMGVGVSRKSPGGAGTGVAGKVPKRDLLYTKFFLQPS